jgi:hypothetical protein
MRLMLARLLVVLGAALCLWVVSPGSASASDCGGGFRVGAASGPLDGLHKCNGYAGNAARVLGGTAVAAAIGLGYLAYRRGARGVRAAYRPTDLPPPGEPPPPGEQPFGGSPLGDPALGDPALGERPAEPGPPE